jgi:hypothetical protein
MDVHKNAPLTPVGREAMVRRIVEGGQTVEAVSEAIGVCPRTVWARYRAEGVAGSGRSLLTAASSALSDPAGDRGTHRGVAAPWTGTQIAREVGVSKATVFRVPGRLGLNRLKALEPAAPIRRCEREHPGELIHIDIKKLGKFNRTGHRITGNVPFQAARRDIFLRLF